MFTISIIIFMVGLGAQRRADKQRIVKKRLRLVKSKDKDRYLLLTKVPNSLSDNHPMDCGNSKCLLCHYEKVMNIKKARDRKIQEMVDDQLKGDVC